MAHGTPGGFATGPDVGTDVLAGIENAFGSRFADLLRGDDGDDVLRGNEGDDELDGGADVDVCRGGAGSDTFSACED